MTVNQIRLKIKDFRAIKEADIILDGITLVAGENGCGKSTLSKFLYYVFKTSNEYDELVDEELYTTLWRYRRTLESFEDEISHLERKYLDKNKNNSFKGRKRFENTVDLDYWIYRIDVLIHHFIELEKALNQLDKNLLDQSEIKRLHHIITDLLESDALDLDIMESLMKLNNEIVSLFNIYEEKKKKRSSDMFIKYFSKAFNENKLPSFYSILEYDSPLISNESDFVTKTYSVEQVAYIDTPMFLGRSISYGDYWLDVIKHLHREEVSGSSNINDIISHDIIRGEACFEEDNTLDQNFIYKREDGSEFNLLDCATGVKSFAMLQMMLKNGFLNKYTLLIIDEPESHLHPQWIIEYARLIVLLNKHIGVKFFLASHNPDMVSAIKYISEKEEVDNKLNFYIAEREGALYTYSYKHLGTDIEPIFESFNIALDRINQYGSKEQN